MVTAFKKCDGVLNCTIDFKASTATVSFDPAKTDPDKLVVAFKIKGAPKYSASIPVSKSQ